MDTTLLIIGLVVAINVLITKLVIAKWQIKASNLMRDLSETHEEMRSIVQEFSDVLSSLNKVSADASDGAHPASSRPKKQETKQPIGFKTNQEN